MGKPIRRTPDEMLRDAVAGDMDLPGKGKPLDLTAYFQPDAEHRMAGKILRDNDVLPPQLQERKDAEEHLAKAEAHLRRASEEIALLKKEIRLLGQTLLQTFSNSEDMRGALGLNASRTRFGPPCAHRKLRSPVQAVQRARERPDHALHGRPASRTRKYRSERQTAVAQPLAFAAVRAPGPCGYRSAARRHPKAFCPLARGFAGLEIAFENVAAVSAALCVAMRLPVCVIHSLLDGVEGGGEQSHPNFRQKSN